MAAAGSLPFGEMARGAAVIVIALDAMLKDAVGSHFGRVAVVVDSEAAIEAVENSPCERLNHYQLDTGLASVQEIFGYFDLEPRASYSCQSCWGSVLVGTVRELVH